MTFERLELTPAQKKKFGNLRRLEQLQKLDPVEFEKFCGYLYERRGYKAHMTATSGDEGVDLLLTKGGKTEVVQCKRYQGTVGQPTVRDLYGTMLHNDAIAGALMTTGRFSKAAETWAANKPIQLIDGSDLMSWINQDRRGAAVNSSWFSSNLGKVAIVALALVAISLCLFSVSIGVRTFQQRTAANNANQPNLAIPTLPATPTTIGTSIEATPDVEATVEATEESPDIAATVTLRATATVMAGSMTSSFEAAAVEGFSLTTDIAQWEALEAIVPTHIVERKDTWNGIMDVGAAFRFAYDADNLYGYVVIADDTHVQENNAQSGYLGDSIEIEIDTQGDRAGQALEDDYQYIISPGDFNTRPAEAFRFRGNGNAMVNDWGTNTQVMSEKTESGYVMAFRIPWFDMRMSRNQAAGTTMGITLNVNDNDDAGTSQQELMISNVSGRRWSQPNTWGTITLGE